MAEEDYRLQGDEDGRRTQQSSVDFDMDAWKRMDEVDPSVHSSDSEDEYGESGGNLFPDTKYRGKKINIGKAEKQFLQTLRKARHFDVVNSLSPARVEGVPPDQLHTLRISNEAVLEREILGEKEDIHKMDHYSIIPPWDPKKFPKVQKAYHHRKERHDKVIDTFRQAVITMSDSLENTVITACRNLRELLEEIDLDLDKVFEKFNDDSDLRMQPYSYVKETWVKIDSILKKRTESVDAFGFGMEELEVGRAKTMGLAMRDFVQGLTEVSYVLKSEVARIVEDETQGANLVLIGNLLAHSECKSRLQRTDIEKRISCRQDFEKREKDWRQLRHDRAIQEFHQTISSYEYTNPKPRQVILEASRRDRNARHEEVRMPLYKALFKIKAPKWKTEEVETVQEEFEKLNVEEDEHNIMLKNRLHDATINFTEKTNLFRENVRGELHSYGALAEKPKLIEIRDKIALGLEDEELEGFYRKSGGLKKDLQWIMVALGKNTLIYQDEATEARERVRKLHSFTPIISLLEKQGKESDREAIQGTLEKLRTGKKKDIPRRAATLRKQLIKFSTIAGLPDLFMEELESILERFDALFPGSTRPRSRSITKKDEESTRPKTGSSTMSTKSFGTDLVMNNLAEVRALQNRAATLVCACELPEDLKEVLDEAGLALHQQIYANHLVDKVVWKECTKPVAARLQEDKILVQKIATFSEEQSKQLHNGALRTCKFYKSMTTLFEKHKTDTEILDGTISDELTDELDRFDEKHAKRERKMEKQLHKLRYSPNSILLDQYFEACVKLLQGIEDGYRKHWKKYMAISKKLLPESMDEADTYCRKASEIFGLSSPQEVDKLRIAYDNFMESLDPEVEDGEEKVKEVEAKVESEEVEGEEENGEEQENGEEEEEQEDNENAGNDETANEDNEGEELNGEEVEGEEGEEGEEEEEEEAEKKEPPKELTPKDIWENLQRFRCIQFAEEIPAKTFMNVYDRKYYETVSLFEIAQKLLGPPITKQVLENVTEEIKPIQAIEPIRKETDENGEILEIAGEDPLSIDNEDGEKVNSPIIIEASGIVELPVDVENITCTAVVVVPYEQLALLLNELRSNFFEVMEGKLARRYERGEALTKKRQTKSTAELEERIRLHWPRKGYADVKYRQPRVYEISQHQKKLERQKRTVIFRNRGHEKMFTEKIELAEEEIVQISEKIDLLESMLDSQTTLAALQGVVQRCKDSIADFDIDCIERVNDLTPLIEAEPKMLIESNARFFNTCSTYEDDGDYDPEEVKHCMEVLSEVDDIFHRTAQNRKNIVTALKEKQEAAKNAYAKFHSHFLVTLQDLSMREGLGKKYGRPRRNAQERLRGEISQCDGAHVSLEKVIELTKELIGLTPGIESDNRTIARRLADLYNLSRKDFYIRGQYLEGLKPEVEIEVIDVDLTGVPNVRYEDSMNLDDPDTTMYFSDRKFLKVVEEIIERCIQDTKDLYESEGKLDQAGPDGVPAKLKTYLNGCRNDAKKYLDKTRIAFRDQLLVLQDLGNVIPITVVNDIFARSINSRQEMVQAVEEKFNETHAILNQEMRQHSNDLRPSLASPNNVRELDDLCRREDQRSENCTALVQQTEAEILRIYENNANSFLSELNCATKAFVDIYSTLISPWHIIRLPGDLEKEMAKERKSLKSLRRKTAAKKAGTYIEEGLIVERSWDGLPLNEFKVDFKNEKQESSNNNNIEDGGEENVTEDQNEVEANAGEGENNDEDGSPQTTTSDNITGLSTRCTRTIIKSRQRSYNKYLEDYRVSVEQVHKKYQTIMSDEEFFKMNWAKRIQQLREKTAEGGFN